MDSHTPFAALIPLIRKNLETFTPSAPVRLLYGRGGRAPEFCDINIDLYPPLIFITLYREYSDEAVEELARTVGTILPDSPLLVQDRSRRPALTRLTTGAVPDELVIREAGLEFYIHPGRGQNPGFFPDMREGRRRIGELIAEMREASGEEMAGPRVLNLFAYTCSLSVAALASGASGVVNIDMNRRSLDIGKRNHRLNHSAIPGGYQNQALFLPHDIYKSFGKLRKEGPYNLIIADPPPNQKGSFLLRKDYPRLLRHLPEMLTPGGNLLMSHNGPGSTWEEFETLALESLPGFLVRERIAPPEDFRPVEKGRGLKLLLLSVKGK